MIEYNNEIILKNLKGELLIITIDDLGRVVINDFSENGTDCYKVLEIMAENGADLLDTEKDSRETILEGLGLDEKVRLKNKLFIDSPCG